jgi:hypothetical protein
MTTSSGRRPSFRDILWLNCALIVIYSLFTLLLGAFGDQRQLLTLDDAVTYDEVAAWLTGGPATEALSIRPLLYPALFVLAKAIGGYPAIWMMQIILWIASINLLFFAAAALIPHRGWALFITSFMGLSFSYIAATFYMLTETLAVFLVSLACYYIVRYRRVLADPSVLTGAVAILTLLCLVKPQMLVTLVAVVFYFIWRSLREPMIKWGRVAMVALLLSPLLLQAWVVHQNSGSWSLSIIGRTTFRDYLYSQMLSELNEIPFDDARTLARSQSGPERNAIMTAHPGALLSEYFNNVSENLRSRSFGVDDIHGTRHQPLHSLISDLTDQLGYFLRPIHFILFGPMLWILTRSWWRRDHDAEWTFTLFLMLFIGVMTTGISTWQMDRLVMPFMPLWILLYAFTIKEVVQAIRAIRTNARVTAAK